MEKKFFITDQKVRLPVNEKKYLLPFLTKSAKNTKYYQTPKTNRVKKEYYAEKLLQYHQFIEMFDSIGVNLQDKSFVDIGTGNGIMPKTLLLTNMVRSVFGTDLYVPFEHNSARIPEEDGIYNKLINLKGP